MAACEELGVIPGKDYARVKAGDSVLNRDGNIVRSDQVHNLDITLAACCHFTCCMCGGSRELRFPAHLYFPSLLQPLTYDRPLLTQTPADQTLAKYMQVRPTPQWGNLGRQEQVQTLAEHVQV